jgi:hypothetical protein
MRFYVSIRSYDDIRVNYTLQRVLIRLFRYFHTNLLNRLHVTDNTTLFKVKQIINSEQRERNNAKFYTSIKYINKNVERRKTKKNTEREKKKREWFFTLSHFTDQIQTFEISRSNFRFLILNSRFQLLGFLRSNGVYQRG